MSLLAPLYFLGALAIGLPVLFHLIRRQPKGDVEFSSLMFLRPTPPRLTRRSRLDNWPLLLIRALAIALLAAAFARPFLRSVAQSDAELPGQRIVLVIDTSASMQRAGLWQQALDKASDVVKDLQPADELAIVTFDHQPKTLLGFEQARQLSPAQLKSTAGSLLQQAKPTWHATEMARAIEFAADLAVFYEADDEPIALSDAADPGTAGRPARSGPVHMILISDMQAGSRIEGLQVYPWPDQVRLDVRKVICKDKTNASASILPASEATEDASDRIRIRVTNSPDATESRFHIGWSVQAGSSNQSSELPVQVPPGQSRVVRMPSPPANATALIIGGDAHGFDNSRYLVTPQPESLTLVFIGDEAAQPRDSLLYYLQRVPLSNARRTVTVVRHPASQIGETLDAKKTPLVVVAEPLSTDVAAGLRQYVSAGGHALVVLADEQTAAGMSVTLNAIANTSLQVTEATVRDYVMLSRIKFSHPIFQAMADPQFNDFTKIRFWSHRTLSGLGDDWQVVASFDDQDPALVELQIGAGRLVVLTAGWQPKASQLALSTKFIPLVYSLFQSDRDRVGTDTYTLGEAIALDPAAGATITTPAGIERVYETSSDLDVIDQPGVYVYSDGQSVRQFAVNLAEAESQTEPIDENEFERFGVSLGKNLTTAQAKAEQRQLRDRELESTQKLWQWLLVAALGLLGLETWLAARWSRRGAEQAEIAIS